MPKNVVIMEGGKGLRFADVSKLITDKSNGNDSWVPTEDRIIRQKYISKNGIYYAKDDGIYGFSKLTVNIPGGAQGYTVPTVASLPYGVEVATTDPSQPMPIIPGTVGSSLIGIDPDTGLRSVATVQPDGTLSKKVIPSAIRVLIPPAKTTYRAGEKIQYAGLVVELLDSGGNNFQDDRFPEGIISWSPVKNLLHPEYNLITPMETAEYSSDGSSAYSDLSLPDTWTMPITFYKTVVRRYDYSPYEYTRSWTAVGSAAILLWLNHEGGTHASLCCGTGGKIIESKQYDSPEAGNSYVREIEMDYSKTIDGKTVYYKEFTDDFNPSSYIHATPYVKGQHTTFAGPNGCWTAIYGEITGGGNIPVRWTSPYDNQTYEDTFEIEVRDSESASNEGGSSEGGGGGHSF